MSRPRPRLRDRLCVAGFLVGWLAPVLWHGAVSSGRLPGEPRLLHRCHDIACLFSQRPPSWNTYYAQVRRDGRPEWRTLDLAEYFPMQPFGHRTRMHRFLVEWGDRPRGREELADFIFRRHRELHPEAAQPVALRFVWTWTAPDIDRPPPGAWQPPPVEELPANRMRILSTHTPEEA